MIPGMDTMSMVSLLAFFGILVAGAALAAIIIDAARGSGKRRETESLRARLGEILAEKEALEKKLLQVQESLNQARTSCEEEKQELRRQLQAEIERLRKDYEKRLEEVMAENKAALALYEAVKNGVVSISAEGCKEVLVQLDGQVLCRKSDLELEVLWPREGSTGDGQGQQV